MFSGRTRGNKIPRESPPSLPPGGIPGTLPKLQSRLQGVLHPVLPPPVYLGGTSDGQQQVALWELHWTQTKADAQEQLSWWAKIFACLCLSCKQFSSQTNGLNASVTLNSHFFFWFLYCCCREKGGEDLYQRKETNAHFLTSSCDHVASETLPPGLSSFFYHFIIFIANLIREVLSVLKVCVVWESLICLLPFCLQRLGWIYERWTAMSTFLWS